MCAFPLPVNDCFTFLAEYSNTGISYLEAQIIDTPLACPKRRADLTFNIFGEEHNGLPTADAGADLTTTVPHDGIPGAGEACVELTHSSTDADEGDELDVIWRPIDDRSDEVCLAEGVYTYELVVTDPYGISDSDEITITVGAETNVAPSDADVTCTVETPEHSGSPETDEAEVVCVANATDEDPFDHDLLTFLPIQISGDGVATTELTEDDDELGENDYGFRFTGHPGEFDFHAPDYYLFAIPASIIIGLIFLVYFGVKFGEENRIRKNAYDKIQEIMAKENELVSLGAQSAAAAHSLGTPLSTILLTVKELQKEFGTNVKIKKDLDLLLSQTNRCREILKKLSMNPKIDDRFLESNLDLYDYLNEIIRSYEEISDKKFILNVDNHKNPIKILKSSEIIYGLRNFVGNANKFSKNKIEIFLKSNNNETVIVIKDDGPGFPKDLIDKQKLGEPYIRTTDEVHISKYGLGLGTFIGKTLLEKNFANINFANSKTTGGAEVIIKWKNNYLIKI